MKVLIVDSDAVRAATLKLALADSGAEVTVAPSGSFALTMLDWNRHDVVASRARIDDMDGHELCAILKSDPSTRDVRFVLIASPTEVTATQTTAAGVDLMLPPTLDAASVVPHVMRLVNGNVSPAPAPPVPAAAAPAPSPAPAAAARPAPVSAPRPFPPPRPVPPPVTLAAAPAAPRVPPPSNPAPSPAPAKAPAPVAAPVTPAAAPVAPAVAPLVAAPPAPAGTPSPAAPAPPPAVPKLKPDPVTTPAAEPPKRYVTAAAAAAAAPWSKQAAAPGAAPAQAAAPPPPAINLDQMPSGTFQGSLEVMDLAELTQALAMGAKNGRLILALPEGGGLIAFEGGRVSHAEFRGTVGEPAFVALLTAAHTSGAGRFCFLPSAPGEKPSPSQTIDKPVDRLLLSIATAIDEKG